MASGPELAFGFSILIALAAMVLLLFRPTPRTVNRSTMNRSLCGPPMASGNESDDNNCLTASSGGPQPARVFVALMIAPEIADALARMARELERSLVRLIVPGDIHLTLVPPWNEASIPDAAEKLRRVVCRVGDFTLEFR